jgi:hypothetical protein
LLGKDLILNAGRTKAQLEPPENLMASAKSTLPMISSAGAPRLIAVGRVEFLLPTAEGLTPALMSRLGGVRLWMIAEDRGKKNASAARN